jgi:hypothetical protein
MMPNIAAALPQLLFDQPIHHRTSQSQLLCTHSKLLSHAWHNSAIVLTAGHSCNLSVFFFLSLP